MNPTDPDATIFRPRYATMNLLIPTSIGLSIVAIYLILAFEGNLNLPVTFLIDGMLLLVWLGVIAFAWWLFSNNFLAISRAGIEYRTPRSRLYARWDQLNHIGNFSYTTTYRYRQTHTISGIYLKKDADVTSSGKPPANMEHFIPLGYFVPGNQWQSHQIGKLIRRYAPHLFKKR